MSTTTTVLSTTSPYETHPSTLSQDVGKTSNSAERLSAANIHADVGSRTGASERALAPSSGTQSLHEGGQNFDAITPKMRRYEMVVFAAMSFSLFLAGWNDGTVGPLLPRIQEVYGVRRLCSSLWSSRLTYLRSVMP
ncbi:hypothetical protein M408DRAFT_272760 [Serendipita vermifera MAFF 305830]|uniref:Uncharacterized protein n=1 Tax=Serendipita vermifera MAFF 305830 TaxID=933852 RepID=A0A0C2WXT2_SERVB|nr:hypothetical protein M408DRAFT_272760 [Serendipita vermifera MAFF 305830]